MAVTVSNFVGKHRIAMDNDSKVMLQQYIDLYTPQYMTRLLGCDLYSIFLAEPGNPLIEAINDPFCIDVNNGNTIGLCCNKHKQLISEGVDAMITGFVYYHFVPDSRHKNTTSGPVVNKNENSRESDLLEVSVTDRYDRAIETYQAIQGYIKNNGGDYPEFNGLPLRYLFYGGAF